jgi:UDP-glucose 4-epimerase
MVERADRPEIDGTSSRASPDASKLWLITGGCGFIGGHLADALIARGDRVRILDDMSSGKTENAPPAAQLVLGDITVPAAVEAAMDGVDGCFHLAAIASVVRSNENWIDGHRVNVGGLVNVLSAARRHSTPVVYASSAAVYGANRNLPLAEGSQTDPLSPYAADKLSCEFQAKVAAHLFGVPSTGLRLFNVYGPRQDRASRYAGVITLFVERILHGDPVVVHGDGKQSRDFIHVADVVRSFLAAMRMADLTAGVFNVCTGRATSLLDLLAILKTATGSNVEVVWEGVRSGDIQASLGDPGLFRLRSGISPGVALEQGLANLVSELLSAKRTAT